MKEEDRKYFIVLMAMLEEVFKENLSTERAKLYFEFLKEHSLSTVAQAVRIAVKECKFFPKIAEIEQFINTLSARWHLEKESEATNKKYVEWISMLGTILSQPNEQRPALPYRGTGSNG